jgi:Tol biopolymer transport system component
MSPEQAAGRPTDTRTDIWAFGVVLFEMLSGRPPFRGETAGEALAEVLKSEPAWEGLPRTTPREVRGLLDRCLRKNPRSRLRDIGDARVEIEDWLARPEATRFVPPTLAGGRPWAGRGLVAASLLAALAAIGVAIWRKPAAIAAPTRTWEFDTGDYETRIPDFDGPVISPDGTMIVFSGGGLLRVRDLDTLLPRVLAGTEGAYLPFWSPDSTFIGYYVAQGSKTSLWKVPARSGAPIKICDAPSGVLFLATWRADATIVFNVLVDLEDARLYAVPDGGGIPEPFTAGSQKGDSLWAPVALSDGDALYERVRKGVSDLVVVRKSGAFSVVEGSRDFAAIGYRAGYLIYFAGAGLWARGFDPATASFTGKPIAVDPTAAQQLGWQGTASLSADGTLVYRHMTGGRQQLEWVDRTGAVLGPVGQAQEAIADPAISPDGTRIAVSGVEDGVMSVWVHDVARGTSSRVTAGPGYQSRPSWAPGGDRLAFESRWDILVQAPDSARPPQVIEGTSRAETMPSWSPDGRGLFFTSGPGSDLKFRGLGEGSEARVFLATPFSECCARPSPDGRRVAYVSDESGRDEVYVREFPSGQGRLQVSAQGGTSPRWSAKGDELFFVSGDTLIAVSVKAQPALVASLPRALFKSVRGVGVFESREGFGYDVAKDGRFVVVRTIKRPERHAVVVENWVAKAKAGGP